VDFDPQRGGREVVTMQRGSWVRGLRIDSVDRVESVCSPDVVGPAVEQVGQNAVDWAARLGYDVAVRCIDSFPEFGCNPAQLTTVRWGTESAAITAMVSIESGEVPDEHYQSHGAFDPPAQG
jgi:hypothetical protein